MSLTPHKYEGRTGRISVPGHDHTSAAGSEYLKADIFSPSAVLGTVWLIREWWKIYDKALEKAVET